MRKQRGLKWGILLASAILLFNATAIADNFDMTKLKEEYRQVIQAKKRGAPLQEVELLYQNTIDMAQKADNRTLMFLYQDLVNYYFSQQRPDLVESYLSDKLNQIKERFGNSNQFLALIYHDLEAACRTLSDEIYFGSIKYYQEELYIRELSIPRDNKRIQFLKSIILEIEAVERLQKSLDEILAAEKNDADMPTIEGLFKKAIQAADAENNGNLGKLYDYLALYYIHQKRPDLAEINLKRNMAHLEQKEGISNPFEGYMSMGIALACWQQHKFEEAEFYEKKALVGLEGLKTYAWKGVSDAKLAEQIENVRQALTKIELDNVLLKISQAKKRGVKPAVIENLYKPAIDESTKGNTPALGYLYMNLGGVYLRNKTYYKGEILLKNALPIIEERYGHNSLVTQDLIKDLAILCYQQHKLEEAKKYYQEALEICQNITPRQDILIGELTKLIASIEIHEEENLHKGTAKSELEVGFEYFTQDQYEEAVNHFLTALNLEKKNKDPALLALINEDIGLSYFSLGMSQKAEQYLKEALDISSTQQPPLSSKKFFRLNSEYANALFLAGNYPESKNYYKTALKYDSQLPKAQREFVKSRLSALSSIGTSKDYFYLLDKKYCRWSNGTKTIYVYLDQAPSTYGWSNDDNEAVKNAFKAWQKDLDGLLSFEFVDAIKKADIEVHWYTNSNETNFNAHLSSEATAMGFSELKIDSLHTIHDWDIYLRTQLNGKPLSKSVIYEIALHEIGHSIGLSHSDNPQDVMFSEHYNDFNLNGPTMRDIATVKALYHTPPKYTNPEGVRMKSYINWDFNIDSPHVPGYWF